MFVELWEDGGTVRSVIIEISRSNGRRSSSYYSGLRPVFTLKSGLKVTGGSGTEQSPYILGA